MRSLLVVLMMACGLMAASGLDTDKLHQDMYNLFSGKSKGSMSYIPREVEELLPYARGIYRDLDTPFPENKLNIVCNLCITVVDSALDSLNNGATIDDIIEGAVDICLNTGILTESECYGLVNNYAPEMAYLALNGKIAGDTFCAVLLGKDCGAWESINDWNINIDPNKPTVEVPALPDAGANSMQVLHISDIHLDLTYTLDAMGRDCGGSQCCTNDTAKANTTDQMAGYWGDYNCDFPFWSFTDMLTHIKESHGDTAFDYIMLTGDFPAHDLWRQGRQANLDYAQKAVDEVYRIFPNTPVYPNIGNHESFPCNSFPSSDITDPAFEPSWIYQGLSSIYSKWLPQEALDTFSVDGYYSIAVSPGHRLISVNSIYCYTLNFWNNWDTSDPVNQLQWLHDELLAAEQANERVHILSHVPTGHSDCLGGWGREFTRIINRFENTVTAQFYGHTHKDEYIVYYEEGTKRPTNIAYIVPSVTTWSTLNPAYRIYSVDGPYTDASMRVLNHETYIMDIDASNAAGPDVRPTYFKLYSALEDLDMANLFPAEWDNLARRMAVDDDLYNEFFTYYTTGGESSATKRSVICRLVTSTNLDDTMCIDIMGPPGPL